MEESAGEILNLQENRVKTVEAGPRLISALEGDKKRNNIVKSEIIDPITFKPQERIFTEHEGLRNLVDFINEALEVARRAEDVKTEEEVKLFKENLVFIGEEELKMATQGIAQHLLEEAQKGKKIIIFPANVRSERYISLRVLEELDYLTESLQGLRSMIKITESVSEATQLVKASLANCLVAIPDDFVVSGTRIQGFAGRIYNSLLNEGFPPNKASEVVEANVVAIGQRTGENTLKVGYSDKGTERSLKIFSYYGIPEYKNKDGKWIVFTGVSLTGTHSSTDYGFETELEKLQEYMEANGLQKDLPMLHNVKRPYEMLEGGTQKYADNGLQSRWERLLNKYR